MTRRTKLWVLLTPAYVLGLVWFVVYEKYYAGDNAGTAPVTIDRLPESTDRASRKGLESSLAAFSNRVHSCTLHNKTIRLPKAPDLILAGAQKAGTSAFFFVLSQHPNMVPSFKFESHFFDWSFAVPPKELRKAEFWKKFNASTEDELLCSARKQYIEENFPIERLTNSNRRLITYEKTPNYMFLPQVPELINKICPWHPKVILMLRDPVARAYSNYQMDQRKLKDHESFETLIRKELQVMYKVGLTKIPPKSIEAWDPLDTTMEHFFYNPPDNMTDDDIEHAHWLVYRQRHMRNYIQRGMYSVQLERWMKHFVLGKTLLVISNDRFKMEPERVMGEVLRFLDAPRPQFFEDGSMLANFTTMRRGQNMVQNVLLSVGGYEPMANRTRKFLEKFYKPYNDQLGHLLGEEWQGLWAS